MAFLQAGRVGDGGNKNRSQTCRGNTPPQTARPRTGPEPFGDYMIVTQKHLGNLVIKDRIAENLAAVESHFRSEKLNDVETVLETFTDDVIWEAPAPNGLYRSFKGKAAAGNNYRQLWASMCNVQFRPLQRFATEDPVVDDCIVTFEVAKVGYRHFPVGSKVEMRLVHIFEMRDGKIAREIVF